MIAPGSMMKWLAAACFSMAACAAEEPGGSYSGIYPHLAYFNQEAECGTGAVVPWAGRLWVITYGPHCPLGSSDKLYEITPDLRSTTRSESVGGTHANRMIHRESEQLNIGPYFIDRERNVRVIPPRKMPGRLTGTARHLTDPSNKLYIATMEEGLYEVDVHTLAVTERMKDGNGQAAVGHGRVSRLPGYHGKGLYSGQGSLVYANNGERGAEARTNPFVPSGALASWRGEGDWTLIRRNQFTEVTGPGGLYGNRHPESDPLWALGWDARSVILMTLDKGAWHSYRLPKASHSYDGAHGWNTEWPRIREIGEQDLLMTMHGMFWRFPKSFGAGRTGGLAPRSTYLKVVGDFCRWQDRIVLGCDDTAKNEFLNKRRAKGSIPGPQSQSNLWFLEPGQLDALGPVIGRGAVWLNDTVKAGVPSDPFLIDGFARRALHCGADKPATFTLEIDRRGDGQWSRHGEVRVDGYAWQAIDPSLDAVWMRLRSSADLEKATAWFHLAGEDPRAPLSPGAVFDGVARVGAADVTGGPVRARDGNRRTLQYAASNASGPLGSYTLGQDMRLMKTSSMEEFDWMQRHVAIPSREGVIGLDEASVVYTDDSGKRFRLPKNPGFEQTAALGPGRLCREVATERDLFNCFGTFYELPARNAGGFARIRPIASHQLAVKDFCSYRGLLVLAGVNLAEAGANRHILRSLDGLTGLWVGAVDDLWKLGKPVGRGGPWKETPVRAGHPSDPYLMTGYDRKTLHLESSRAATITVEIDVSGMGDWFVYRTFALAAGEPSQYHFPKAFQAYWVRFVADVDTQATAQLVYR